jgi:small subunit ribosomal protein S6
MNEVCLQNGTKFPREEGKCPEGEKKMRQYETIFVVNPTLTEETYREAVNKLKNVIEKQKGVIVKAAEWGTQRLAYTVKKFDRGAYVLFNYCGDAGVTTELERELKLDDRILKYQTVKIAEDVDPQALMAKEQEGKKAPEPKESKEPLVQTPPVQAPPVQAPLVQAPLVQAPLVQAAPAQAVPVENNTEKSAQEVKSHVG